MTNRLFWIWKYNSGKQRNMIENKSRNKNEKGLGIRSKLDSLTNRENNNYRLNNSDFRMKNFKIISMVNNLSNNMKKKYRVI